MQEAYARALRYCRTAHPEVGPGWMFAIVRNVGYDWLRRRHAAPIDWGPRDLDEIQTGDPSPEAVLLAKVNADSLRQSLSRLPADQRRVVVLRDLEQLSYKEIAGRAGIPIGTVMSRLARGRAKLRELLNPQSRSLEPCSVSERSRP